jgi:hypothetical protein
MNRRRRASNELDLAKYDWSKATRGRFAARFAGRSRNVPVAVRILDDDLAEAFPDSDAVNRALRVLVDAAKVARKGRRSAA